MTFELCCCFGVLLCYRKKVSDGRREGVVLTAECLVPALWLGLLLSIASLVVSPRFLFSTKIKPLSYLYVWGFLPGLSCERSPGG